MDFDRSLFNPSVGELVRFRSWEDMVEEFGDDGGEIPCQFTFTREMLNCGLNSDLEFVISQISDVDGEIYGHDTGWCISKDMLEYPDDTPYDSTEIGEFLDSIQVKTV